MSEDWITRRVASWMGLEPAIDPDTPEGFYKYERFIDTTTIRRIKNSTFKDRITLCHYVLDPDERASLVPSDG